MSASTVGDTLDVDGYTATLDGGEGQALDPDGTVSFEGVDEGDHEVALTGVQVNCAPDGGSPRTVTVTAGETATAAFDVACEPALLDRIVFTSRREGGEFDVHVMAADGSGVTQLTDDAAFDNDPDVTADGGRLVFASGTDVAVLDGWQREEYTGPSGQDFGTAWSPDGSRIALANFLDELWVMNADGTGLTRLTDNDDRDRFPTWSPLGSGSRSSRIARARSASGSWTPTGRIPRS